MQNIRSKMVLDKLPAEKAGALEAMRAEILSGFSGIVNPPGGKMFTVNPVKHGNGVEPIKVPLMSHLERACGWELEKRVSGGPAASGESAAGPVDAYRDAGDFRAILEFETGNVASSYRVLLKFQQALLLGQVDACFLVLSEKKLARYLTDRIGTEAEIAWTFQLFPELFQYGHVEMLIMGEDAFDTRAPLIPKQASGNGVVRQRKAKKAPEPPGQMSLFAAADVAEDPRATRTEA